MTEMSDNHAFMIFTFAHNWSLYQNQYYKPVRTVDGQSESLTL